MNIDELSTATGAGATILKALLNVDDAVIGEVIARLALPLKTLEILGPLVFVVILQWDFDVPFDHGKDLRGNAIDVDVWPFAEAVTYADGIESGLGLVRRLKMRTQLVDGDRDSHGSAGYIGGIGGHSKVDVLHGWSDHANLVERDCCVHFE